MDSTDRTVAGNVPDTDLDVARAADNGVVDVPEVAEAVVQDGAAELVLVLVPVAALVVVAVAWVDSDFLALVLDQAWDLV